jgi:hypothetical protein
VVIDHSAYTALANSVKKLCEIHIFANSLREFANLRSTSSYLARSSLAGTP